MDEFAGKELQRGFFPTEVRQPIRVIPAEKARKEAPEFNFPRTVNMIFVGQRQAKFGDGSKPFFTPGLTQCELEILETSSFASPESPNYGFIHVQSGELEQNEKGSKITDIAEQMQDVSSAIVVSGSNSINVIGVSRELEGIGVIPMKHIIVDTRKENGNTWLHVAFRPNTDEILVKIGSDEDFTVPIQVFSGFRDVKPTDEMKAKSTSNRTEYLKKVASGLLLARFQDVSGAFQLGEYEEAQRILNESKQYALSHGIDWGTLPKGWSIIEQRMNESKKLE